MSNKPHKTEHQVSLKRPDGFYTADNELVEVFAPLIGIYALGVYHLLKQRSFKREVDRGISQQGIAKALAISKDSAGNALATLKLFYLVEETPSNAPNRPPRYEVVHAKDVLTEHPEFRTEAQGLSYPHNPQVQPEIRTRKKTIRSLKSGRVAVENQDANGRNSGRTHPEFRTPNKEEESKEERQIQDSTPLPPKGGGNNSSEDRKVETENETTVASGVVRGRAEVPAAFERMGEVSSRAGRDASKPGCEAAATQRAASDQAIGPSPRPPALTLRQQGQFFLQYLHEEFPMGYGSGLGANKGINWEDPYTAWVRCFEHVGVGDVEADGDAWVVVLETKRPKDLQAGLQKYSAKVQIAMKKAFGREVQLVPRLEAA